MSLSLLESCKPRRWTTRHLAFATVVVLALITLYYTALPQAPPEHWSTEPSFEQIPTPPEVWQRRTEQVKQAFRHAYAGYERHAMPHDELLPLTNSSKNNFNGWAVTVFDSLDTMILMGLNDEFARALPVVAAADFMPNPHVTSKLKNYAPFFETVIRYLGGLLAAYALSHEPILLQRADDLGRLLSPAFNTTSGFPMFGVNTANGTVTGGSTGILAEIASCQLEYSYLALMTGNKDHFDKADTIMKSLARANVTALGGMLPRRWNLQTAKPADDALSVGAAADSAHEYLLKQYLLTAKTDRTSYQMYLRATNEILTRLLYVSENRDLLYVTDTTRANFIPSHRFEHLSCFLPGLLALGADQLDISMNHLDLGGLGPEGRRAYELLKDYDLRTLHKWVAEGLATTCYLMYADQPTGLGPDEVRMLPKQDSSRSFQGQRAKSMVPTGRLWVNEMRKWRDGGEHGWPPGLGDKKPVRYTLEEMQNSKTRGAKNQVRDYTLGRTDYLLRPETLESIYIMWRTTGDPIWRERGWAIFEALERETKTDSGYASVHNVLISPAPLDDDMPR
ncbi:uncharacterized protein FIBRA_02796 [Fibroporia radiculosa]|uniref:alpha-1,2-Mannosidase n=1 Tax=Fibroporia radiculosa TaxID=599839 RepID=J4I992_9APHY|nr:uncharacterized protein FIBRA_02796 [Fibroporia radiculosa]CCM00756.1 predicted protein [Fibroporia radiculosa]